jgi:hypothetical protein
LVRPQCYYESPTSSEEVDGELIAPSYLRSISTPYNPTTITFKRESSNELHYDVKDLEYSLKKVFNSLCPSGCGAPHPFYYLGTEPETPLNVEGTLRWSRFKLTQIFTPDRHIYLSYNDNSSERRFLQKLDIYGVDSPIIRKQKSRPTSLNTIIIKIYRNIYLKKLIIGDITVEVQIILYQVI